MIIARIVHNRFGPAGLYTLRAHHDPDVDAAVRLLPEARGLLELGG